ncbi:TPA: hypothetical protein EYO12_04080 [Candidatus Saccharibacteria bacterium]|nr:hypothetical protein [Candidatus Saccharibacteria bacterium]HIO87786.1 hypothetical protein [Candidatus Saccharibacteria bacterium]
METIVLSEAGEQKAADRQRTLIEETPGNETGYVARAEAARQKDQAKGVAVVDALLQEAELTGNEIPINSD